MKKILLLVMLLGSFSLAADKIKYYPIDPVFNIVAKDGKKVNRSKFHFGSGVSKTYIKNVKAQRKANAFGKDDKKTCEWAFLSSLKAMEDRLKKEGAKKAVNCHFGVKDSFVSGKNFQCQVGFLMSNVTLVCDIVK